MMHDGAEHASDAGGANGGYLERLPIAARMVGDIARGEIEITRNVERCRGEAPPTVGAADPGIGGAQPALPCGVVFEDAYVLVVRDPVKFPSGAAGTYLRVFERSALDGASGVVILPVEDGTIVLRRIFRHATRAWETECPRGFREHGASPEQAARAELREEMGYVARELIPLGPIASNTGLLAGIAEAYLAFVEPGPGSLTPEATEAFGEVRRVPVASLMEFVASGEVRDGFTLAALMLAAARGLLRAAATTVETG